MMRGSVVVVGLAACLLAAGCVRRPSLSSVPTTPVVASAPAAVTLANCTSSGCHGGSTSGPPSWENAASLWLARDPHRNAFFVLYTERAIAMVQRLNNWPTDQAPDDAKYLQFLEQRCTGCHAIHESSEPADRPEAYALGVTCVGCHGEASHWGHTHYQNGFRDANGNVNAEDVSHGFNDLRDLSERASACMQCHVGPGKGLNGPHDMNHDLIAAGHPRLNFEFSAYLANLPPHWDTALDEKRHNESVSATAGSFNFDAWLVGQMEIAKSRSALSNWRKTTAAEQQAAGALLSETPPWPELSEFDCYQCHHSFSSALFEKGDGIWDNWRQDQTADASKLLVERTGEVPTSEPLPLGNKVAQQKLLSNLFAQPPVSFEQALQALLSLDAWLADQDASLYPELREQADNLRKGLNACYADAPQTTVYSAPTDFQPLKRELAAAWQALGERLREMNP